LIGFAKKLASEDEKFRTLLADSLMKEFMENDESLDNDKNRRWTLIGALSSYGKEFGLSVD